MIKVRPSVRDANAMADRLARLAGAIPPMPKPRRRRAKPAAPARSGVDEAAHFRAEG
jgi:hypothetical protein